MSDEVIQKEYFHLEPSSNGMSVNAEGTSGKQTFRVRPMDEFSIHRFDKLKLLEIEEWMSLTDQGMPSSEAWRIAGDRFRKRWNGGAVGELRTLSPEDVQSTEPTATEDPVQPNPSRDERKGEAS
tara:strand:- start:556 stop:930 length:375 start_codon:yes stop_codon:yes gene_type:complete